MKRSRPKSKTARGSTKSPGGGGAAKEPSPPRPAATDRLPKAKILIAAALVALIFIGGGIAYQLLARGAPGGSPGTAATASLASPQFVGSDTCAGCHEPEARLWLTSQHKLAMDHATDSSVLGDFNDASFDYFGVHSRFFRKDGKFLVETDGPDGKLATFEVKYTFGVDPLQQYLVAFPDGRLQALSLAWDSRPKDKGGQRWFHLYPDEEIRAGDFLHWTKLNQNWNFMCAECHSTGVRKNYDAATDHFATTWAAINVGCEACHGQGSAHIAWAKEQTSWWPFGKREDPSKGLLVSFDDRAGVAWSPDPATGNPHRNLPPSLLRKEVETCGLCHARRGELSENWIPGRWLSETHAVSPLVPGLYSADGQMLDEVYNYGSFKQSKMFAEGVTCSDCHDPHSAALRLPGNGVCLQCHAAKYESAEHSHHTGVDPPLACSSCHMPARTYMVVDRRHDHSFRIPRPDLSVTLGTPNACNDCHADKTPAWAATAIEGWFGPEREGFQHYAEAFHAGWSGGAGAAELLASVAADGDAPAIARASALTALAGQLSPANLPLARGGLRDRDPMVRLGALDMLEGMPLEQRWPLAAPLLSDSVQGVRIRAAALLADAPIAQLPAADRERLASATDEFIAAQRLNADRPEGRAALASFYARRGQAAEAEAEYLAALKLSPQYAPAAANLADLYRQLGRESESESVLRAALASSPNDAGLHHALGLTLVRTKQLDQALAELRRANELDPGSSRYAYVYAVALDSSGRRADAIAALKDNLARHPDDRDTLMGLISFSRDSGDFAGALTYAEQLARLAPADQGLAKLIGELRAQAAKP